MDESNMTENAIAAITSAASDTSQVRGLTHRIYHYPARFSPIFVREMISRFTEPGDTILDPFMGGGTTIVEGHASGRITVGYDINELSTFVTKAKVTSTDQLTASATIDIGTSIIEKTKLSSGVVVDDSMVTNIKGQYWRVRRYLGLLREQIHQLPEDDKKTILLASLLRTGQLILDRNQLTPSVHRIRSTFLRVLKEQCNSCCVLHSTLMDLKSKGIPIFRPKLITGNAKHCLFDYPLKVFGSPKLVLTSPPYPGVHVLYHRWQVSGRKETNAPYWLAGLRDGHGASYYTFGDRKNKDFQSYFDTLFTTFSALRQICDRSTIVAQLVGFSDRATQLPRFLDVLSSAGFNEWSPGRTQNSLRIERVVPNRRWYTRVNAVPDSSETLLVHRI
jgi:DNA modification methylase